MTKRHIKHWFHKLCLLCLVSGSSALVWAAEHHGKVTSGGFPVPGATVTATQGDKKLVAITDELGIYSFPDLSDGSWTLKVEMLCFVPQQQELSINSGAPSEEWKLAQLPLAEMKAAIQNTPKIAITPPVIVAKNEKPGDGKGKEKAEGKPPVDEELSRQAAEGLLVNGSQNNGASSPFAQMSAFGNQRGRRSLYNGSIGLNFGNSIFDAKPYSLTGLDTAKPDYNRVTGLLSFGGPLRIPHLLERRGPNIFLFYQWTRNRNTTTSAIRVPDLNERAGILSNSATGTIYKPGTDSPFDGNIIPQTLVSPQAKALLNLYPLPNLTSSKLYNYQSSVISASHIDAAQARVNKYFNAKNQLSGSFGAQSARNSNGTIFGFVDTTEMLGLNASATWTHRLSSRLYLTTEGSYSRQSNRITPFFSHRENVSGAAGITGNNQEPTNWGPPTLAFSNGIAPLSDGTSTFNRDQTAGINISALWSRGNHKLNFGGEFRRQQFNILSQQNPRGTFSFTGAATQGVTNAQTTNGSDFADFLLGVPDTSTIAYGNADKYFRQSVSSAFLTDDWRVKPDFTLNLGLRWDYGTPITELFGRLVNLDIANGFTSATAVVANSPVGGTTKIHYPDSLLHPDHTNIQPRIGLAWRPIGGSSFLIRAGYGIYYDTGVYQPLATQMSQQAPLSTSLRVSNSSNCGLTLQQGFRNCGATATATSTAIDPNYKVGYAQNWQLSAQRDLPWALQMVATYLGTKGTHGRQEFLPNSVPIGATNPCPSCPLGFVYSTSGGASNRHAGQLQLRRRLLGGFGASLQYTFAKAMDNDSVIGGKQGATVASATIAQDWNHLEREYSLSSFDQRHQLTFQMQYSSGMGLHGGGLMQGWRGRLLKQWTVATDLTTGSGTPETPIYSEVVPGTGITGTIRPDVTGTSLYSASAGHYLNGSAYRMPENGRWGNARRYSITGPLQFNMNASAARDFRFTDRYTMSFRLDASNFLNKVTFSSWNTNVSSAQLFGLPSAANAMRSMQTSLRLRF